MAFWKLTRRKRFTLLKFVLVGFAVAGVMFWFNQVRNIPSNNVPYIQNTDNRDKLVLQRKDVNRLSENGLSDSNSKMVNDPVKRVFPFKGSDNKNLKAEQIEIGKQVFKPSIGKDFRKSALQLENTYHNGIGQILAPVNFQANTAQHFSKDKVVNSKVNDDDGMKVTPGLGENGAPVFLPAEQQKIADELFSTAAFNVYISDRIALNRSVPDPRNPKCRYTYYDYQLPTASVIIIFTNEVWSALLRTIHSVAIRSPSHLLHEIILVDDFSDKVELKDKLEKYIFKHFPPNLVKIIRLTERQGLVRARLAGAKSATGDVLVFLDSHCETNIQWLEPLLQRIKGNRKAVLCPIIDVIDDKTLEYYASNLEYFQIGGFTWNGHFTWIEIPEWEEKRKESTISPTRTPTMAGGLFAIDRSYFWEIGSYDSGMDIWGGENLEMSFRVWMCGGTLEIVPCSHVGHIFRSFHPYIFPGNKDTHGINTVRTVEVWMDSYKQYFYMYRHDLKNINYGDITERINLKKNLKCKTFQWYLNEVYPQKFILDRNVSAYGIVKNPISNLCLDTLNRDEDKMEPLGLFHCKSQKGVVMNQMLSLSDQWELRREENCAEVNVDTSKFQFPVLMVKCHGQKENQEWRHEKGGPIIHISTGKCLDAAGKKAGDDVYVTDCHGGHSQIWWFENYMDIELELEHQR